MAIHAPKNNGSVFPRIDALCGQPPCPERIIWPVVSTDLSRVTCLKCRIILSKKKIEDRSSRLVDRVGK